MRSSMRCSPERQPASTGTLEGLTIGVGLRLTGWVGAHRTTIVNSEAALDLGNIAATLRPAPQLCLSTPMLSDGKLVGVLTIYSTATV